ncbi:unnamed protein product [Caenorhabditis angaria]|uniref:Major facilitator superfamily (MFS) profile domain-containing protein n=1 Tax=Caenorhabditis angaria TaxID=860376 RepID=A0A9P1NAU6_9PELO|nr:unnamed protein product [Caenorhabditis angaria]
MNDQETSDTNKNDLIFAQPTFNIKSDTDLITTVAHLKNSPVENHPLIYSDPELTTQTMNNPSADEDPEVDNEQAPMIDPGVVSVAPSEKSVQGGETPSMAKIPNGSHLRRILKLIGGCSYWQIIVYLMISVQQVPHAMFNLSVVYMMYQPDHWCKIPFFNAEAFSAETGYTNYTWDQVLGSSIAFPWINDTRRDTTYHDRCNFYKRDYVHIKLSPWEQVKNLAPAEIVRCKEWEYDKSIMQKTVVTEWNRVCDNNWSRAHVHLSYSLGYLLGCLVGGFVSDRYGRKTAIYGFGCLTLIFGFLLTFSKEFEIFLVVRFLLAASNEASDLAAYVLCMEITGVKYRSMVGSLLQAPWACGYAFLALIAYITKSWTAIHMITVILHLISMILIHFLPESPRWLIMNDRVKEAEKIIRKACHYNKSRLPSDLGLIRHAEKRKWMKRNERPSYFHIFRSSELFFRNMVLFIVWIATALVYYGIVIALSDQSSPGRQVFDGNFFLNNAIAGAIELPTLLCCVFLLKMGRKKSQMFALFGASFSLLAAVITIHNKSNTLSLLFMLLSKACIQGSFNILYIFTSELNPTVVRNTAVGISSMIARMGAGASGYIAILSDVTLPLVPNIIFAIFSLVAGMLVLLLPETQGLPLPETILDSVQMIQRNKKPCGDISGTFIGPKDEDTTPYSPSKKLPIITDEEDISEKSDPSSSSN